MVKATTLTLAAALIAGGCAFAYAQGGGAGGEPPRGSDANPPGALKTQPNVTQSAPATGAGTPAPTMTQRPAGMKTTPSNAGTETGTAPDPAGAGAERKQH